jgi:hypothetical protein
MWIMTPRGFYSAVQKFGDAKDDMITVRARAREDLENLSDLLPGYEPYREKGYSDYPWRIRIPHQEWNQTVSTLSAEIDYNNFKDEVKHKQGQKRASVYGRIWSILLDLEAPADKKNYGSLYGRGSATQDSLLYDDDPQLSWRERKDELDDEFRSENLKPRRSRER